MLTWFQDTHACSAGDAAASLITRLATSNGMLHDPGASLAIAQRQEWYVPYLQCYVLNVTTGTIKQGLVGELIMGLDSPGSWIPLGDRAHHTYHPNFGMIYHGNPIQALFGVGWAFYKGALANGDRVILRALIDRRSKWL